ncbi:MAG: 50S ribosomal protein L29 [bacterium]
MKIKELKTKNDQELDLSLKELREKLRKIKFDLAEKKLKNIGEISDTRKTIARILTLIGSRGALQGRAVQNQKHEQK